METQSPAQRVLNFLNFYGLKPKSINLRTDPKGQVETCTGVYSDAVHARHRRLIEKEFEKEIAQKDFRFQNRKLSIESDGKFSICLKQAELATQN